MRQALDKTIGALKTLTIPGEAGGPCVVLFHGYGADASDLAPLAEMMGLSNDVTWVFPEAPMEVIIAPGFYGKAWFQIDTKRLENAMRSGEPADLSQSTPGGLEGARKKAEILYAELLTKHDRVVIGGFSQGAMLATELALTNIKKPAGLVLMSAGFLCKDRWQAMAHTCRDMPFIQTHGKNDALLGFDYAENLYDMLSAEGLEGNFISFGGGHEIPPKIIEKIGEFLASVCIRGH